MLSSRKTGHESVETDCPSGPYWLHGPSRSRASYMLQIILQTDWTVMNCRILLYTLSLYGHILIIAIIVLIHLMSIVLNFYCSLLDADCCMIGLLIVPLSALSPTAPIVSKHLVMFTWHYCRSHSLCLDTDYCYMWPIVLCSINTGPCNLWGTITLWLCSR